MIKKKETRAESMPRKCILVANLFTELCGSRRRGDAIVAKESLSSYQKDAAPRCQVRSKSLGRVNDFRAT